jgi:hypothetical protein
MATIKIESYSANIKIYPAKTYVGDTDYIQTDPNEATHVFILTNYPTGNGNYSGTAYQDGNVVSIGEPKTISMPVSIGETESKALRKGWCVVRTP